MYNDAGLSVSKFEIDPKPKELKNFHQMHFESHVNYFHVTFDLSDLHVDRFLKQKLSSYIKNHPLSSCRLCSQLKHI